MVGNPAASGCVRQRTLKSNIRCSGTGLHSGASVSMTLQPAAPGTGVVFCRTDTAAGRALVPATWQNIADGMMRTTIANADGVRVATIEHLMAALSGCGVDNVFIEIDGPEVAIMDGSAEPFVFLIECAGLVEQDAPRRAIEILKPISVGDTDRMASLSPGPGFTVSCEIDFDSAAITQQAFSVTLANGTFKTHVSRARTFGFAQDAVRLRAAGLARGGSLENVVVVSDGRVLNKDGLRYEDEFARHKVLDCIGDLYLAGAPIQGRFDGRRSGHAMNHRLVAALFADESTWRYSPMTATPLAEDPAPPEALAASA